MDIHHQEPQLLISFHSREWLLGTKPSEVSKTSKTTTAKPQKMQFREIIANSHTPLEMEHCKTEWWKINSDYATSLLQILPQQLTESAFLAVRLEPVEPLKTNTAAFPQAYQFWRTAEAERLDGIRSKPLRMFYSWDVPGNGPRLRNLHPWFQPFLLFPGVKLQIPTNHPQVLRAA